MKQESKSKGLMLGCKGHAKGAKGAKRKEPVKTEAEKAAYVAKYILPFVAKPAISKYKCGLGKLPSLDELLAED